MVAYEAERRHLEHLPISGLYCVRSLILSIAILLGETVRHCWASTCGGQSLVRVGLPSFVFCREAKV